VARSNLLDNDWTRIMGLQYSYDDFDVGEDNDTTLLLRPLLGFSRTVSDSPLRPTQGYRLNVEFTGATEALLSDINFLRAQANAKIVQGLGEKFRFLGRVDLGYTETRQFDQMPSNLRFFAGGDNSVRGYDYESLGPEDSAGDVVGGEGLIVGSVEIDYVFRPDWSAALFVDTGNAFNTDQIDLKVGAGFGIRWQSPIGPIRVDLGFPVDEPDADDTWRLHFSLGPDL
jgi:translocation and assembly module TamA